MELEVHEYVCSHVYGCTFVCRCMCKCVHMHEGVRRVRIYLTLGIIPQEPATLVLDTVLLIGTLDSPSRLGWLASEFKGSTWPGNPRSGVMNVHHYVWLFAWVELKFSWLPFKHFTDWTIFPLKVHVFTKTIQYLQGKLSSK